MTVTPDEARATVAQYSSLHQPFYCSERLRNNPPLLAHYTSIDVAENIIKNEEIWFSHPFYMNDLYELRFGMQQGIQLFPTHAQTAGTTPPRTQRLIEAFTHYVGDMNDNTLIDTYVLCLCEHDTADKDGILSMWRSYASQGHGIALVFNAGNIPDPPQAPLWIAKVIYRSLDDHVAFLNNSLAEWTKITLAANLPDDRLYLAAYAAFLFVKAFSLVTKHKGFSEEEEWRIVYVPEYDPGRLLVDQFGYHVGPRGAEPKLKFKIAPVGGPSASPMSLASLLEFILLGPSISSPIAQAAFRRVLKGTCIAAFEDRVFASTIPLRPIVV